MPSEYSWCKYQTDTEFCTAQGGHSGPHKLQARLATAPPEQALADERTCGPSQPETEGEAGRQPVSFGSPSVQADPPQPASAGALELSEDEVITCILDSLFPSSKIQILAADTTAAIKLASGPDGLTVQINKRLEQRLAAHDQKVREPLAAWMIANSFATGHGDSMEDLLRELKWQVEELRGKVGRVSMVELMEHDQKVREQAKDELIMRHRCGCETCTHTSELCPATKSSIAMERTSLEQRDQKVRAETLEEAAQEVEKLNELWPVTCMDQPYRDAAQAIRSLVAPAPAASKPEAGSKGEK